MNVLLFGAGKIGKLYYDRIKSSSDADLSVLAFIDNRDEMIGGYIEAVPIISPSNIGSISFDKIIITVSANTANSVEILEQLKANGISQEKIELLDSSDFDLCNENPDMRVSWLKNFAYYSHISNR